MAYRFGTEEWAAALRQEIDGSSEYRNAGARWGAGFNGNVLLCFEADESLPRARSLLVRLKQGACEGVEFVEGDRHPEAGFALRAPFALWRQILERKTLAATAILTGRMRVEGDRLTLLKHTAAHRALVHCASSVETTWDGT